MILVGGRAQPDLYSLRICARVSGADRDGPVPLQVQRILRSGGRARNRLERSTTEYFLGQSSSPLVSEKDSKLPNLADVPREFLPRYGDP